MSLSKELKGRTKTLEVSRLTIRLDDDPFILGPAITLLIEQREGGPQEFVGRCKIAKIIIWKDLRLALAVIRTESEFGINPLYPENSHGPVLFTFLIYRCNLLQLNSDARLSRRQHHVDALCHRFAGQYFWCVSADQEPKISRRAGAGRNIKLIAAFFCRKGIVQDGLTAIAYVLSSLKQLDANGSQDDIRYEIAGDGFDENLKPVSGIKITQSYKGFRLILRAFDFGWAQIVERVQVK